MEGMGVVKEFLVSFKLVYKYFKKKFLIYICKSIYCKIYVFYGIDYMFDDLMDVVESFYFVNDSYVKWLLGNKVI